MKAIAVMVVGIAGAAAMVASALGAQGFLPPSPSKGALVGIPPSYLAAEASAAASCPGLSWSLLAGVAYVESHFGAEEGPSAAGALGPYQFLPGTFAAYDHPVPGDELPTPADGGMPPSPYDLIDATWAAARMLCANGAASDAAAALYAYNHSESYVAQVLAVAASFQVLGADGGAGLGARALSYALTQLGRPYVWGGSSPASGFDCSGLTSWAYAKAGVVLGRTAQAQYDAGRHVVAPASPVPGDLVFFGSSVHSVSHVGIYLGEGLMVDAPHAGAVVRVEPDDWPDYLGATAAARP